VIHAVGQLQHGVSGEAQLLARLSQQLQWVEKHNVRSIAFLAFDRRYTLSVPMRRKSRLSTL
jgi:O-acetyl-ADP-ribose deacetylase (regulator of RNase III)